MKDAGSKSVQQHATPDDQPKKEAPQAGEREPAPMRRTMGEDARGDPRKQRDNQKRMGVASDHRTLHMEKKKRGTFP